MLQVYQLYLNQWLQIRWRRWMTKVYPSPTGSKELRIIACNCSAMPQTIPTNASPRTSDSFIERALTIGVGLLSAIVTLASFVVILWTLSAAAPLDLFGGDIRDPGLSRLGRADLCDLWARRSRIGSAGHWSSSISISSATRADFRFNLVRVRENSSRSHCSPVRRPSPIVCSHASAEVVSNWHLIMSRQKRLTFFTTAYNRFALVFPFIVVSPAYFAGNIQLGGLVQTAGAFGSVETALSFFVTVYRDLAEWRAVH